MVVTATGFFAAAFPRIAVWPLKGLVSQELKIADRW
jgi:hypothetical protein